MEVIYTRSLAEQQVATFSLSDVKLLKFEGIGIYIVGDNGSCIQAFTSKSGHFSAQLHQATSLLIYLSITTTIVYLTVRRLIACRWVLLYLHSASQRVMLTLTILFEIRPKQYLMVLFFALKAFLDIFLVMASPWPLALLNALFLRSRKSVEPAIRSQISRHVFHL